VVRAHVQAEPERAPLPADLAGAGVAGGRPKSTMLGRRVSDLAARARHSPGGRLLHDHVRSQLRWLVGAVVCMVAYAATTAGQAWLMQPVLDRVFLQRDELMLVLVPVAVILMALVKGGADYGQTVALARVGQRISADLQQRLFRHLLRADLGYFMERGSGPLISGLTYDTQRLRTAASSALTGVARDSVTIVFLIALMVYQDWRLALVALIVFPIATWPIVSVGRRTRKVSHQGQAQMAALTARLEQTFQGVRQVKADNREDDEAAETGTLIERLFGINVKAAHVRARISPIMEVLGGIAIGAVILYGGSQVLAGQTTPGTFFSFVTALLLAYQPLKSLAKLNTQIQEGLAAAERIYTVLDHEPAVGDRPGAVPLRPGPGEIRFARVRFGYRPDRPALHDIELTVPAGQRVALVGPSGAGKSTMLNLILRFYDPDGGAVLIDGQDVGGVTLASLRARIALVSQDVDLFDDTVRANIAYGRPGATLDEITAAAVAAAAHDFIMTLPGGYDAVLGPSGASLSGGQRQRLGIARAMLKDAPILLLDEATSALDSEAERIVQAALERLMRGRTSLVIAHRLSTIINADLIAVVEDGRIVETGTHHALLARGGVYARLYDLQFADQQASLPATTPALGRRRA
jgi:ATP-binding cassette, subfamily B, bacterial MsbA